MLSLRAPNFITPTTTKNLFYSQNHRNLQIRAMLTQSHLKHQIIKPLEYEPNAFFSEYDTTTPRNHCSGKPITHHQHRSSTLPLLIVTYTPSITVGTTTHPPIIIIIITSRRTNATTTTPKMKLSTRPVFPQPTKIPVAPLSSDRCPLPIPLEQLSTGVALCRWWKFPMVAWVMLVLVRVCSLESKTPMEVAIYGRFLVVSFGTGVYANQKAETETECNPSSPSSGNHAVTLSLPIIYEVWLVD